VAAQGAPAVACPAEKLTVMQSDAVCAKGGECEALEFALVDLEPQEPREGVPVGLSRRGL